MFKKIHQTVEAFSYRPPERTIHDEIEEHGKVMQVKISGNAPTQAARIGVIFAVSIPSSYAVFGVLHQFTNLGEKETGVLGMVLGMAVSFLTSWLHGTVQTSIPFHKFNPFFGNKIEETIASLKHRS